MSSANPLAAIHRRMKALGTPARAAVSRTFFKTGPGQYAEGDKFLGLTVPNIRLVAREYQALELRDAARLLTSEWHEERLLALLILVRQYQRGDDATREAIHTLYLKNMRYINNWDLVDLSAEHIVGPHLKGKERALLVKLAKSKGLWERRVAMLSTFHYIKAGEFRDPLRIAALLIGDEHDLIHKAVGWMLRELGKRDQRVEEAFLQKYAHGMSRTTLRYAIERFPEPLRKQYLAM